MLQAAWTNMSAFQLSLYVTKTRNSKANTNKNRDIGRMFTGPTLEPAFEGGRISSFHFPSWLKRYSGGTQFESRPVHRMYRKIRFPSNKPRPLLPQPFHVHRIQSLSHSTLNNPFLTQRRLMIYDPFIQIYSKLDRLCQSSGG
jgi:hypothetical protein